MSLLPLIVLSPSIILIAAAVIPAVYLLVFIYRNDRLEKEPRKLLFRLIVLGILATLFAEWGETAGIALLPLYFKPGSRGYELALYFLVVGLAEEGFKYLLMRICTWKSPEFNCQFHGVVYAVFTSLGFALWENVMYVISYGMSTAIARAITAIPGHACFGVFMGTFYGAAKRFQMYGDAKSSRLCRILALMVPVLLHGAYDYLASSEAVSQLLFVVFIALLFFAAFKTVKTLSKRDRYL